MSRFPLHSVYAAKVVHVNTFLEDDGTSATPSVADKGFHGQPAMASNFPLVCVMRGLFVRVSVFENFYGTVPLLEVPVNDYATFVVILANKLET